MPRSQKTTEQLIENLAAMTKRGFDEVDKRFDAMDKRFDAMDKRFDAMDKRFDRLEFLVTGHDRRIEILEDRVRQIAVRVGLQFK